MIKHCILLLSVCFIATWSNSVFAQSYIPSQKQKVYIKGVEVISNQQLRRNTIKEELPDELQSTRTRMAIENRQQIRIYDHSPSTGPKGAAITIIEFNDLSCNQCREVSKKVDEIREKHPKDVRHIYVHTPIDAYNATNPAAFYGRIAYDNGIFWKYRSYLYQNKPTAENIYMDTLVDLGMEMDKVREDIKDNARRYYREIDADTKLAADMGENTAPAIFINGIRIGSTISMENVNLLVTYELEQFEKRQ